MQLNKFFINQINCQFQNLLDFKFINYKLEKKRLLTESFKKAFLR